MIISDRELSEKEKNSSHKGDFSEKVEFGKMGSLVVAGDVVSELVLVVDEGVSVFPEGAAPYL